MENMDKGLTALYQNGCRWFGRKYLKCANLPNLSVQGQKLEFNEKRLHWASVLRAIPM